MRNSRNPLLGHRYDELDGRLETYAEQHVPTAPAEPGEATRRFVRSLGEAGITAALNSPGDSLDSLFLCRTREILAYHSALCDTAFAMQGLGTYPILLAGSSGLREKYVAPAARGEAIAAFAVTEPQAGSDVAAIQTIATKKGDRYILNGTKTLISNAGIADQYVVFALAKEGGGRDAMLALVVDAKSEGLRFPRAIDLIAPHPIGDLEFVDCSVPAANRLCEPGEGFSLVMRTLDRFRATVGASALGLAERAFDEAVAYTQTRRQFGRRLCDLGTVKGSIGEMVADVEASRMLIYRAAYLANDNSSQASLAASTAKYFATEAAQRVVDTALQLHGGNGVVKGFAVERLYREVRALRLYEGTSEIQKAVMANAILKSKTNGEQ